MFSERNLDVKAGFVSRLRRHLLNPVSLSTHLPLQTDTQENKRMVRTIAYWATTGIIAAMSLFAGFVYLSGSTP